MTVRTVTVVMRGYWIRPAGLAASNLRAKSAKSLQLRTLWRLYAYETLLQRLTQHVQDVAAELWQFIQKENPMVRQRHFARQRHLAAPD